MKWLTGHTGKGEMQHHGLEGRTCVYHVVPIPHALLQPRHVDVVASAWALAHLLHKATAANAGTHVDGALAYGLHSESPSVNPPMHNAEGTKKSIRTNVQLAL